ncbi:cobalt-zinc-cadmium efflux system protein [Motilibacter peucedani]|uniref:Cobalt-zinc-cadmium efflux system protein n=1 Tax=Motilibacter peucedani TaxID=598650 RepID=A0A420XQ77_9ACTN|nr:cation diffusion facilitator family transporter [Motilibacter peucedani]RKS75420.1 cobalt-zinc-cadmium efflux system protein [Motilibacter peucedani]
MAAHGTAGHVHSHAPIGGTVTGAYRRRLALTLALSLTVLVVEAVGAWAAGSVALLADAGHMLSDSAGVGISLLATTYAQRPPSAARTFGWQRAEVLAALANGVLLAGVSAYVLVTGVRRLFDPGEVHAALMLSVAAVGLVANAVALSLLHEGAKESLNVRSARLEVFSDLLGSAGVVVAGIVLALTGWDRADAVAAIAVGAMVVPRAVALLHEAANVLLEATPRGVDLDEVRAHILEVPGVVDVHDLHAWTITSGMPVLSAHVVVPEDQVACGQGGVLDALGECLGGHFDVEHCTFQIEPAGHRSHEHSHHD